MLLPIVFTILFFIHGTYSIRCPTVEKGEHFSKLIPFHGFNDQLVITTRVQLNNNTAWYLFPPTEPKGEMCSNSWNKLWGATRCGYLNDPHADSDEFMWRRAVSCYIFDSSGHVIGEKTNCSEAGLIEMTAGTWDNGTRPYDHPGTLLKQFATKLRIDTWYRLTLRFSLNQTIYELADGMDKFLERQTVNHRVCSHFNEGAMLDWYFGGECTAPQPVTACYE